MDINRNHLFYAFCLVTIGLIVLVTVGNATFDRSEVVKAFVGMDLILVGGIAGSKVPG